MITKGTQEYEKASKLARLITSAAGNTGYARYEKAQAMDQKDFDDRTLRAFLKRIEVLGVFASKIAESVLATMSCTKPYAPVALCSSKQAWCLACAAVEANISFYEDDDDDE